MIAGTRTDWTVDALMKRIAGRRHEAPGRLSIGPAGSQQKSVRSQTVVRADTDVKTMRASASICTPVVDREGEVILPDGLKLDNYRKNPIVLWEHGDGSIDIPIATSENPETGELGIELTEDEAIGHSHFFAKDISPESYQFFGLIDAGAIRATSIQAIPLEVAMYHDGDGNNIPVTEVGDLIEYSWTCIGVNPTALKKSWKGSGFYRDSIISAIELQNEAACRVLQTGSLGMDRLLPVVRKSLKPLTGRTQTLGIGAGFSKRKRKSEKNRMTEDKLEISVEELAELDESQKKALAEGIDDYDDESKKLIKKALASGDDEETIDRIKKAIQDNLDDMDDEEDDPVDVVKKAFDTAAEGMDDEDKERIVKSLVNSLEDFEGESAEVIKKALDSDDVEDPMDEIDEKALDLDDEEDVEPQTKAISGGRVKPGALFLQSLYDSLKVLDGFAEEELQALENVQVKSGVGEELEQLRSVLATVEGLYAQEYPEMPSLGDKPLKKAEDESEVETQLKSMLGTSRRHGFQAGGIERRLRQLRQVKGMPKAARTAVTDTLRDLSRLITQSKSYKPSLPKNVVSAKEHRKVLRQLNDANEAVQAATKQIKSLRGT